MAHGAAPSGPETRRKLVEATPEVASCAVAARETEPRRKRRRCRGVERDVVRGGGVDLDRRRLVRRGDAGAVRRAVSDRVGAVVEPLAGAGTTTDVPVVNEPPSTLYSTPVASATPDSASVAVSVDRDRAVVPVRVGVVAGASERCCRRGSCALRSWSSCRPCRGRLRGAGTSRRRASTSQVRRSGSRSSPPSVDLDDRRAGVRLPSRDRSR